LLVLLLARAALKMNPDLAPTAKQVEEEGDDGKRYARQRQECKPTLCPAL